MAMPYDSSLSRTATKLLKDSQDNGAIAATRVYGQPDFTSHRCGTFGADFRGRCNSLFFSLADSQGNLYVSDYGNSRVLYYPTGSTTATRVYGQPDFTARGFHPGCNSGGVSATSLCNPFSLAVDDQGNLYVDDDGNGRVLYYPAGSTTATRVYGQPEFTSRPLQRCNSGTGGVSATSLCDPSGLTVDGQGNLYVNDSGNSRVLYYPAGSTTATRVYGQPDFTSHRCVYGVITAADLCDPSNLIVDSQGDLYVVDSERVLYYPAGGTTATRVYGHADWAKEPNYHLCADGGVTSSCGPTDLAVDSQGNLYVSDYGRSQVLYYPAGSTTATRVYGQPNFNAGDFHRQSCEAGNVSATSLCNPFNLAVDDQGDLYVNDSGDSRVLYYPAGSTTATRVYGQPNFTSRQCNTSGVSAISLCGPSHLTIDSQGNLYVDDEGNSRVLYYPASVSPPGHPPVSPPGHPPVSPPGHPPVSCSAHPRGHPPVKDVTLTLLESSIFANAHLDLVLTGTPCTGVATTAFVTATHLVEFPIGHRRTTPSTTVLVRGAQRGVTDGAGHLYERVVVPSHDTDPIQATVIVLARIGHQVVVRHASVTVNPAP